jgi:hypothetical protein
MQHLEHRLGALQILEPVSAQIAQGDLRRQVVGDQAVGRLGEEELAAVRARCASTAACCPRCP